MKRARIGIIATAVLAIATMAFAQKPDFSGSWAPEPAPDAAAGGGGGRGGGPMTIKQTATEITIERAGRGGNTMSTVYKLDGSETKVAMGQMGEGSATAKWDGNKLVITTKMGDQANTQTLSLDAGVLTIDRTGGRGPSTTKYKKTT
jgi:hypothetical protein